MTGSRSKQRQRADVARVIDRAGMWCLKAPIHAYRWTVRPWLGWPCRHLPTCSDYALESIDKNGPWRGFWLTLSRLSRCHPWGTAGFDPVPDLSATRHRFAPWRYGRWTGAHMPEDAMWTSTQKRQHALCSCLPNGDDDGTRTSGGLTSGSPSRSKSE